KYGPLPRPGSRAPRGRRPRGRDHPCCRTCFLKGNKFLFPADSAAGAPPGLMRTDQADRHGRGDPCAMEIRFPGGLEVEAVHGGFKIVTDQPTLQGGGGSAPTPFDLFLASIGTCAGLYALRFCEQRNLDSEGLGLELTAVKDTDGKRVAEIRIEITLPPSF